MTGRLLSEHRSTGIANDNQAYEKYDYQYDFADNCTRIGYDINTGPLPQTSAMETLVVRLYDGKNRLSNRIQGDSFYGNLEYKYAPGGQLTQITGWNFEENLFYGQAPGSSSCASYNGNLSARIWSYKNTNEESMHGYRYYYDSMNRLKQAVSTIGKEPIRETNEYNEEYSYDLQGNILSLQRNGGPRLLIDDLHMTYDGNQLKSISDHSHSTDRYDVKEYHDANESSEEFAYNANGCLNKDLDCKISSIQYNCLNLPDTVLFDNGNQLVFRYDGEGNKWEEHSFTVTTPLFVPVEKALRSVSGMSFSHKASTAWSGNLECESVSGGNYKLSKVHHPEGYIEKFSWSSALYNMYYRHDYQGNVREVWRYPNPGVPAATVQYIQYYPGGMPWAESDNAAYQSRKYSGKRYLEMHGYDSYDFMARTYAPDYNRFTTMDPLCEKYYGVSPYAYCMGNPVTFVDPDGRKVVIGSLLGRIAAFFGADNFESHVKSQIEELKEADKEVKSMIEKMEDSKFEVKIVPTALTGEKSSNSTLRNHKNASIKQGSTIYYNQNSQSTQSGKRPPIVGLAHELGHADDYINGRGINLNKKDVTNKKKDIQNAEEHAIEVENKVRKALDIPLRPLDYFAK